MKRSGRKFFYFFIIQKVNLHWNAGQTTVVVIQQRVEYRSCTLVLIRSVKNNNNNEKTLSERWIKRRGEEKLFKLLITNLGIVKAEWLEDEEEGAKERDRKTKKKTKYRPRDRKEGLKNTVTVRGPALFHTETSRPEKSKDLLLYILEYIFQQAPLVPSWSFLLFHLLLLLLRFSLTTISAFLKCIFAQFWILSAIALCPSSVFGFYILSLSLSFSLCGRPLPFFRGGAHGTHTTCQLHLSLAIYLSRSTKSCRRV